MQMHYLNCKMVENVRNHKNIAEHQSIYRHKYTLLIIESNLVISNSDNSNFRLYWVRTLVAAASCNKSHEKAPDLSNTDIKVPWWSVETTCLVSRLARAMAFRVSVLAQSRHLYVLPGCREFPCL